jgi:hypothetical protein
VNNQLFKINLGFTLREKRKLEWMEKKLMKKLDEKVVSITNLGILWFYTPRYK